MTIGRSDDNDITLSDNLISKTHCSISYGNHKFQLADLGSTNGIYANGKRLKDLEELDLSSYFQIGETVMKVEFISEQDIESRDNLIKRANHDPLTGAYNRFFFMDSFR